MDEITLKLVGTRLKEIRENLGLSQTDVAKKINKGQGIVSALENGNNGGIDTFFLLINLYKDSVYIPDLFKDNFDFYYSNQKQKDINIHQDLKEQKKNMMKEKVIEIIDQFY